MPRTLIALLCCALAQTASADWILLHNGHKLRGEVTSDDGEHLELQLPSIKTTIKRSAVKMIIKEPTGVYFNESIRTLIRRGDFRSAKLLAARAAKANPADARLANLSKASDKLAAAADQIDAFSYAEALPLVAQAIELLPKIKALPRILQRYRDEAAHVERFGTLPGPFRQLTVNQVVVLHHHTPKAKGWGKRADALIDDAVKRLGRSKSHRLPKDVMLILAVYRNAEEYRKGIEAARPYGVFPETDEARLVSRTRGATHMGAIDEQLPTLIDRWVAVQLHEFHPLWITEGLVAGGHTEAWEQEKQREKLYNAASEAGLYDLLSLSKLTHYGELETPEDKARFKLHSTLQVRFVCGFPGGRRILSKAVSDARNAVFWHLFNPKLKRGRLKSYRMEDLVPQFLAISLPKALRIRGGVEEFDARFANWLTTGSRKKIQGWKPKPKDKDKDGDKK